MNILTLNGRFFLSHFLCVKVKEPKLRDFLSMGITRNWELEFFEFLHPGGPRMLANLAGSSRLRAKIFFGLKQSILSLKNTNISCIYIHPHINTGVQVDFTFQVWSCISWFSRSPEIFIGACGRNFWLRDFRF